MNKRKPLALSIVILCGLLVASVAWAGSASYDLFWWTVDSGGATFSSGGSYELGGTIGQPDAGTLGGGDYALGGGFWGGGAAQPSTGTPGDCNGDGIVSAGDISALVLEIFDGDGDDPADTPGGTFLGNPVGCNANGDTVVSAGDISYTVLLIFGGSGERGGVSGLTSEAALSLPFGSSALSNGPALAIPDQVPASPGGTVTLPINFTANGHNICSMTFSVDYDQTWLSFDATDGNEDGIPDAITLNLPGGFEASVTFDGGDTDGELDFFIGDLFPPLASLSDGTIVYVTLNVGSPPSATEAAVNFSQDPAASFGNTEGQDVPGTTDGGSVLIAGGATTTATATATPTSTPTPTGTPTTRTATPTSTATLVMMPTNTPQPTPTPLHHRVYLPMVLRGW
jgi:hypothetical protein